MTNVMPIIKKKKKKALCLCKLHKQSTKRLSIRVLFL